MLFVKSFGEFCEEMTLPDPQERPSYLVIYIF